MRTRAALMLVLALLMGALSAAPAIADGHEGDGGTYLALGDSVPAGYSPGILLSEDGYPNMLFDKLQKKYDFDELVNLSCPGDDTLEMLGVPAPFGPQPDGSVCYGDEAFFPLGGDSQIAAAVEFLLTNPGEVELITITVGANDIFRCNGVPAEAQTACLQGVYGIIMGGPTPTPNGSLGQIIQILQAYAPGVPIVAMNYYQPNLALSLVGLADIDAEIAAAALGNSLLEGVYTQFDDVYVADVQSAFKTDKTNGSTPKNVKEICKLTLMCEKVMGDYVLSDWNEAEPGPQPDIHPSEKGHKKIAKTFEKLIKKHKLIDKH